MNAISPLVQNTIESSRSREPGIDVPPTELAANDNSEFRYNRGSYSAGYSEVAFSNFNPLSDRHLIAIHGMVESPDIWRGILHRLAPKFLKAFEVSMPWHCDQGYFWGFEAKPGQWLEPVFSALPAGRKVIIAHSFGANALLDMLQHQQRDDIDALILLSPYHKSSYEDFTWDLFRRFVSEFEAFVAASIRVRQGGERITAASLNLLIDKVKEKYGSYSWMEFYELYAHTPGLKLDSLKMPVLVIGGDRDLSIIPDDLKALTKRIDRASFKLLINSGHFGMIEQPDALTTAIHEFISDKC